MGFQYRIDFSLASQKDTDLPLLFVARMMVIFLLWIRGMDHILPPFLPFLEGFNALRGLEWLFDLLDWVYWISLVMVFAGIRYRFFVLVLGILIFFSILSSKPQFSNSFLYSGCVLFLIGIFKPGLEWIFRVQIALLYFGAGLNKMLDPDWISGRYFHFFFTEVYPNGFYQDLNSIFPPMFLPVLFSFGAILTELGFAIWATVGRKMLFLFIFIHLFHLVMLVLTFGALSYIFYFLMAVSSYLILPWKEQKGTVVNYPTDSRFFQMIKFLDFDRFFEWIPENEEWIQNSSFGHRIRFIYSYFGKVIYHKMIFGIWVLAIVFASIYRHHILNLF